MKLFMISAFWLSCMFLSILHGMDVISQPSVVLDRSKEHLIEACHNNDYAQVQNFLESGADPNFLSSKISPLIAATIQGHQSLVRLLLISGASPSLSHNVKISALRQQVVRFNKYLCRTTEVALPCHAAPLLHAAYHGYHEIVYMLLKYGADPNERGDESLPPALYFAVQQKNSESVGLLLEAGADIECLHGLDTSAIPDGCVRLIIRAGLIFPSTSDVHRRAFDQSPLSMLISAKGTGYISMLESSNVETNDIQEALAIACGQGTIDLVQRLIAELKKRIGGAMNHGMLFDAMTNVIRQPFVFSVQIMRECIHFLQETKQEGDDERWGRLLKIAVIKKNYEAIKLLLRAGAPLEESLFYLRDPFRSCQSYEIEHFYHELIRRWGILHDMALDKKSYLHTLPRDILTYMEVLSRTDDELFLSQFAHLSKPKATFFELMSAFSQQHQVALYGLLMVAIGLAASRDPSVL